MFCAHCGSPIPTDSRFCPSCGKAVVAGSGPAHSSAPTAVKGKGLLVVIAALLAIAVAVAAYLWWDSSQKAQATHSVIIAVSTPEEGTPVTRIPVQVTGTDVNGSALNEVQYAGMDGTGVELTRGSYTLSFPAGPLTREGTIYRAPASTYDVVVEETLEIDAPVPGAEQRTVELIPIPELEVTDEDIESTWSYAKSDPTPPEAVSVDALRDTAIQMRDEAVAAEEARVEAERKAAEEEAARVEARKTLITANASTFLSFLYDGMDRAITIDEWRALAKGKSLQSGWPGTRNMVFEKLIAVDENTVEYALSYEATEGSGSSTWLSDRKSSYGTIIFDSDGNIDYWYPNGMTTNRLIG